VLEGGSVVIVQGLHMILAGGPLHQFVDNHASRLLLGEVQVVAGARLGTEQRRWLQVEGLFDHQTLHIRFTARLKVKSH